MIVQKKKPYKSVGKIKRKKLNFFHKTKNAQS